MEKPARQQIIDTTSRLLETQGYHGTGLNQIIKESGAPRGSLYYYFPEGKEELAAAAIAQNGRVMAEFLAMSLDQHDDPIEAIDGVLRGFIDHARGTHCCAGAPLATVALETAATSERLREGCQQAYRAMRQPFEAKLLASGFPPERAAALAMTISAAIEGAIVLSRTERDVTPLEQVVGELRTLLRHARLA